MYIYTHMYISIYIHLYIYIYTYIYCISGIFQYIKIFNCGNIRKSQPFTKLIYVRLLIR